MGIQRHLNAHPLTQATHRNQARKTVQEVPRQRTCENLEVSPTDVGLGKGGQEFLRTLHPGFGSDFVRWFCIFDVHSPPVRWGLLDFMSLVPLLLLLLLLRVLLSFSSSTTMMCAQCCVPDLNHECVNVIAMNGCNQVRFSDGSLVKHSEDILKNVHILVEFWHEMWT